VSSACDRASRADIKPSYRYSVLFLFPFVDLSEETLFPSRRRFFKTFFAYGPLWTGMSCKPVAVSKHRSPTQPPPTPRGFT